MKDQDALGCRVAQPRPGQLDFLQLPQDAAAEVLDGIMSGRVVWIRAELAVDLKPGEAERSAEGEGAIGEPQVEIEAQGAVLEGLSRSS